jgi:hypothetical protein
MMAVEITSNHFVLPAFGSDRSGKTFRRASFALWPRCRQAAVVSFSVQFCWCPPLSIQDLRRCLNDKGFKFICRHVLEVRKLAWGALMLVVDVGGISVSERRSRSERSTLGLPGHIFD